MEEIWKDIKGYEGFYQVSNLGRIRSVDRYVNHPKGGLQLKRGKILKGCLSKLGYIQVSLSKNNKIKMLYLHRIVATHFIPNTENKPCIDHIDTNPLNNAVENLRWCTQKENMNNLTTIKKLSKIISHRKGNESPHHTAIIQFDLEGNLIRKWDCIADAAKSIGRCHQAISSCCVGNIKTCANSKWEYYNTDRYLIALMIKTLKEREMRKGVA